jgi:hypothetical protein
MLKELRMKTLTLLFSLLFLTSCAQEESGNVKFVIGGQAFTASSMLTGGIAIYGQSDTGLPFAHVTNDELAAEAQTFEIPKGNWTFVAMGWDSDGILDDDTVDEGKGLEGNLYCGKSIVTLDSDEEVLSLSLTKAGCADPLFGDADQKEGAPNYQPLMLKLRTCVKGADGICHPEALGPARSYKLILTTPGAYDMQSKTVDASRAIVSDCKDHGANKDFDSPFKIPMLNINTGVVSLIIETYDGAGCTGTPSEVFKEGPGTNRVAVEQGNFFGNFNEGDGSTFNRITLASNVCQGDRLTNTPFASGAVSGTFENLICTPEQFSSIPSGTGDGNFYFLANDIDFENGTMTSIPDFRGSLNGLGFSISNLTVNGRGIFAAHKGTTQHYIRNLYLDNITVEAAGSNQVGALVGALDQTGSMVDITSVSARNITINDANWHVGALVGYMVTQNSGEAKILQKVEVLNSFVSCQNAGAINCGGLVGFAETTVNDAYPLISEVSVRDTTVYGQSRVGGVVGHFTAPNIAPQAHFNALSANNVEVVGFEGNTGGVIGEAIKLHASQLAIIDSQIRSSTSLGSASVGGVIGQVETSTVIYLTIKNALNSADDRVIVQNIGGSDYDVGGAIGRSVNSTLIGLNAETQIQSDVLGNHGGAIGHFSADAPRLSANFMIKAELFGNLQGNADHGIGGAFGRIDQATSNATDPVLSNVLSISSIQNSQGENTGGFAGIIEDAFITLCGFDGDINTSASSVGGFAGKISRSATGGNYTIIDNSFAQAMMNNSGVGNFFGGFVGNMISLSAALDMQILNSYSFTDLTNLPLNYSGFEGTLSGITLGTNLDGTNVYYNNTLGTSLLTGNFVQRAAGDMTNPAAHLSNFLGYTFDDFSWYSDTNTNLPMHQWARKILNFDGGSGSPLDPFIISRADQFNEIKDDPLLMIAHFQQVANLDFSATGGLIEPVGTASRPFEGSYRVFNGDYYMMNGTVNVSGVDDVGIFRVVKGAHIGGGFIPSFLSPTAGGPPINPYEGMMPANLMIDNITLSGNANVGTLVGRVVDDAMRPTHIEHVGTLNNNLTATDTAGGIIGFVDNADYMIRNVVNNTQVAFVGANIGGIIGKAVTPWDQYSSIDFAVNHANINTTATAPNGEAGGIIGYAENLSEMYNSKNTGTIAAPFGADKIGGLIGYHTVNSGASSFIKASTNWGIIQGNLSIAGLVGQSYGTTGGLIIDDSYSKGEVSAGSNLAAGIIALADGGHTVDIARSYVLLDDLSAGTDYGAIYAQQNVSTVNIPDTVSYVATGSSAAGSGMTGSIDVPSTNFSEMALEITYPVGWNINDEIMGTWFLLGEESPRLPIDYIDPLHPQSP